MKKPTKSNRGAKTSASDDLPTEPAIATRARAKDLQARLRKLNPKLRKAFTDSIRAMANAGRLPLSSRTVRYAAVELSPQVLGVDEALDEGQLRALAASVLVPLASGSNRFALSLASPNRHELSRLRSELCRFETFPDPRRQRS